MPPKSNFLDKVLGRIGRLDAQGLQTVVQRLARERSFLETLFNTIEDGVLVVDENGRIIYLNSAVSNLVGVNPSAEGQPVFKFLPEFDWEHLLHLDSKGGPRVIRQELEITLPRPRGRSSHSGCFSVRRISASPASQCSRMVGRLNS